MIVIDIERALSEAASLSLEFIQSEEEKPVAPCRSPSQLKLDLDLSLNEGGLDDESFIEMIREVMALTPRTGSRGFYNQLFGGRDAAATMAELLTVIMNSSMYTFKVAGPHVLIEQELIGAMCSKIGYDSGGGILCPGGSVSNMVAMMVARNQARPGLRQVGHDGTVMKVYSSSISHYSIVKNAGVTGIGRENVRLVDVDSRGRMKTDELEHMIEEDKAAGCLPVMIVATAGTTVLGAFDPIAEMADIARDHGIWLHVDGALGGSVLLSRQHRHLLHGSEMADSFAWNPHKMMNVPVVGSAAIFRNPDLLTSSFYESVDYIFQTEDDEFNPGTRSLQCGRRNDAFKIWATWKYHGDEGLERKIDRHFALARYAAEKIEADDILSLALPPESVNVCFEVPGKSSEQICELLRERELAVIGYGLAGDRRIIRLVCLNDALSNEDIDDLLENIKAVAEDLP